MSGFAFIVSATLVLTALLVGSKPALAEGAYEWGLECKGDAWGSAVWWWTQDGIEIPGTRTTSTCGYRSQTNGTGIRPMAANGFNASLLACVPDYFGRGCDSASTVDAFNPAGSYKVHLNTHANGVVLGDPFCYVFGYSSDATVDGFHCKDQHYSGGATLRVAS